MPFTGGIGVTELIIVLVIVLVIFGPKRLPELGKSLGSGMKSFKDSVTNSHDDDDNKTLSTSDDAKPKAEPVHTEKKSEAPAAGSQSS